MSRQTDAAAAAIYGLTAIMQRSNNSPEAERDAYEQVRETLAALAFGDQLGEILLQRAKK